MKNKTEEPIRAAAKLNEELPSSSLKQIGNELRTKMATANAESLPAELQAMLLKLERKFDGKQ
ncbi:hypothetical protein [Methylocystis sp.]|uniref:hypothetical protein n=1 Tax=Methylocystis sp. TaxID=1911079 RepID=UPI003DA3CC21